MAGQKTETDTSKCSPTELQQNLETITQDIAHAINQRNFDINENSWIHFSPEFAISEPFTGGKMDLEQFLTMMKGLTTANPEYFYDIRDISFDLRDRTSADVFLHHEIRGSAPGIVRRGVRVTQFRL